MASFAICNIKIFQSVRCCYTLNIVYNGIYVLFPKMSSKNMQKTWKIIYARPASKRPKKRTVPCNKHVWLTDLMSFDKYGRRLSPITARFFLYKLDLLKFNTVIFFFIKTVTEIFLYYFLSKTFTISLVFD